MFMGFLWRIAIKTNLKWDKWKRIETSDCCILHIILHYITKPISVRRIQENTEDEYKTDIYVFTFKKNL